MEFRLETGSSTHNSAAYPGCRGRGSTATARSKAGTSTPDPQPCSADLGWKSVTQLPGHPRTLCTTLRRRPSTCPQSKSCSDLSCQKASRPTLTVLSTEVPGIDWEHRFPGALSAPWLGLCFLTDQHHTADLWPLLAQKARSQATKASLGSLECNHPCPHSVLECEAGLCSATQLPQITELLEAFVSEKLPGAAAPQRSSLKAGFSILDTSGKDLEGGGLAALWQSGQGTPAELHPLAQSLC